MIGCPACKSFIGRHGFSSACVIVPIRCKRWTCRWCRQVNLRYLLQRIKRGKANKFVTLTCKPADSGNPADTYWSHRGAVRRIVQTLRRKYGALEYVCITELTKLGQPHFHLLVRSKFIPQVELSRLWFEVTGSRVVDIRKIGSEAMAAGYVAKYVTKNFGPQRPNWLKRIVQFSRGFAPAERWKLPKEFEWELDAKHPEEVTEEYTKKGMIAEKYAGFTVLLKPDNLDYLSVMNALDEHRGLLASLSTLPERQTALHPPDTPTSPI